MKSFRARCTLNTFALCWVAMSSNLFAAPPYGNAIQFENISKSTTTVVHGSCGNAFITISGIDSDHPTLNGGLDGNPSDSALNTSHPYLSPQVEITVLVGQPGRSRQKSTVIPLDEASVVRCVDTKSGKKVLVGTECRGNAEVCYKPKYYVVDAQRITNPATKKECDAKCANQKLDGNFIKARE